MYKEALTKSGFNDNIIYPPVIKSNNSEKKRPGKKNNMVESTVSYERGN